MKFLILAFASSISFAQLPSDAALRIFLHCGAGHDNAIGAAQTAWWAATHVVSCFAQEKLDALDTFNDHLWLENRSKELVETAAGRLSSAQNALNVKCDELWLRNRMQEFRESGCLLAAQAEKPGPSLSSFNAEPSLKKPDEAPTTWGEYPTSQRIQIPEPCPLVAKWLAQAFSAGSHWQMLSYAPDVGTLTFKVIDMALTKGDIRRYVIADKKTSNVHVDQVVVTLRSLVTSTLSFDNAHHSSADSCTIAFAFKLVSKDGTVFGSNGNLETEILQRLKARYAEKGLDY
jgi:hypothetical protein